MARGARWDGLYIQLYRISRKQTPVLLVPREIMLRLFLDWDIIQQNLKILEEEKLVTTKQLDTLVISTTKKGIEKVKAQRDKVSETS